MNSAEVRRVFVRPSVEYNLQSVTTGGLSDITSLLEWFKERLNRVAATNEIITKAELEYAIKYYERFGENLFELFDRDCNGSISLPEFLGGLSRLTKGKKRKNLVWFENLFKKMCDQDSLLNEDEFIQSLHTNGFSEKFIQLIDGDGKGRITVSQILDALGKLTCMDADAKWLAWFEEQFNEYAGESRQITLPNFKKAFNMSDNSFIAERIFQLFDEDNSGTISLTELVNGLSIFLNGSDVEKLHFLFQIYDMDGNGCIEFEELKTVLKSCMKENAIKLSDCQLNELTKALFDDADTDHSGSITFEELQIELEKHPGIIENLTLSASNWLRPPKVKSNQRLINKCTPSWLSWKYFINNCPYIAYIFVIQILINTVLFIGAAVKYRESGVFVPIARGCGQCLNYNSIMILVLMLRQSLTLIRSTPLSHFLPLDHHIELHKITAYMIYIFSVIHCFAHLGNFTLLDINDELLNTTVWEYLFSVDTPIGWVGGMAGLTGWVLILVLSIICIFALPCIRRKGFFELFYWTHNFFVLWYILLILHGPNFWKWMLLPGSLYTIEWILRLKIVKLARYGRTFIQEGLLLPSDVIHLVISRPHNFSFQAGDYIFINIPAIAKYEWHPFTISSAPEQMGAIWLHIRSVGTWTRQLYSYFKKKNEKNDKEMIPVKIIKEPFYRRGPSINSVHPSIDNTNDDIRHPLEPSTDSMLDDTISDSSSHDYQYYGGRPRSKSAIINVQLKPNEDKGVEVYIDGPYGAPSAHIFQAEHAVLIGAGIGVTPFASILQSIVTRYRNAKHICPKCNYGWTGEIPSTIMKVKKVDFYWINRHQKSFEWFISMLSQLELEQSEQHGFERFLEMHMYMTSAFNKSDIKAIGLQMALELIHKKDNRDLITGLKTRTQAGRPDWDKIFQHLKEHRKGKVTVFFCGAPALSRILRQKCVKYGFSFRKENF